LSLLKNQLASRKDSNNTTSINTFSTSINNNLSTNVDVSNGSTEESNLINNKDGESQANESQHENDEEESKNLMKNIKFGTLCLIHN
jgi:hypothetical protein